MTVKKRMSQEERRTITREKLIKATIDEIVENGYANLTTKGITERSGVTWGAAQHLFGDRENLVFEVAKVASERHVSKLKAFKSHGKPEEKLKSLIEHVWGCYNDSDMQAYYEISNGNRRNEVMSRRMRPFFSELSDLYDMLWQQILADFNQPLERIAQVRQLVILTLSGLAQRERLLPEEKTVKRVLSLLEELALHALTSEAEVPKA